MHLKASKYPTVVVLYVSFSYPVVSVRRSISFKLNQMSPVVVLVHVARLSKCKVDVVRSICSWTASVGFPSIRLAADSRVPELAELPYQSHPRQLLDDFAPWRRLLIRDNQLTVGSLVNVIILGLAICNHSETKKKGETKWKIQSCASRRVSAR